MHNLAHNATIAIQPVVYGMLVLALASSAGTTRVAGQEHPRTDDGAPDLNGVWQVVGDYHQNIEPHAISGISAGSTTTLTIRPTWLAGRIPYNAAGRELQQDNAAHRIERDPAIRCHAPGIPRATYMPYPFQIIQTPEYILFAYEFAGASRIVYMNRPDFDAPADAWMGHSRGTWEGDTLVVNVAGQLGTTWLDANGNYHSDRVHVVERYTPINPSQLFYEATIDDPEVFRQPWTISLPIYRVTNEHLEFTVSTCDDYAAEFVYGRASGDSEFDPPWTVATNSGLSGVVPEIGSVVTPVGELIAWERYPSGVLFSQGEEVTRIHFGQGFVVIGSKTLPSILDGDSYYLKIRSIRDDDDICARRSCWVYQGRERDLPRSNLVDPATLGER